MIPRDFITEWRANAPWVQDFQVEQDLVICRALVEIFSHPLLKVSLAFRGGTALNKIYIQPPARYSEDLDFVITAINVQREVGGPLAEILDTISFTIRERIRIKGEISVLTAQVVMSGRILSGVPFAVFILLWFINQQYMGQFFQPQNIMCGGGALALGVVPAVVNANTTAAGTPQSVLDGFHPALVVPACPARREVFRNYVRLGVEGILAGPDYLLFVLGLVLLAGPTRRIVSTLGAFTLGHSITLTFATLGLVDVPSRWIEVAIAASVLALAVELARPPSPPTLLRRRPTAMAVTSARRPERVGSTSSISARSRRPPISSAIAACCCRPARPARTRG